MNTMPAYSIRSLIHAYDGRAVLEIPQLEIASGEICALVGPNGSGKTTLLSILALLLSPGSGSVLLNGLESARGPERQRLRRQVTLVHQKPVLFSTTVWNNVSYGLRALGLPAREIKVRVGAVLEELGLSAVADRQARKISGGEAQRAVLARGLVLQTPILLLDEPTSSLDEDFRPILWDLLRRANHTRNTTIVVATHDSSFVSACVHRSIRLEDGKTL
jgi:tungstate transport system ATP-binding protein